jgi:hypothetical protein
MVVGRLGPDGDQLAGARVAFDKLTPRYFSVTTKFGVP